MRTMLLAAAVAAALFAPATSATATLTKDQAFHHARNCLLAHGARTVMRRPDGGGLSFLPLPRRGTSSWTYKTFLGQVESVTVYFGGVPGPTLATKRMVRRCVSAAI